jgi:hypothetical protein
MEVVTSKAIDLMSAMPVPILCIDWIRPKERLILVEVLRRGLNTWQRQNEPEGELIRKLIRDLEGEKD